MALKKSITVETGCVGEYLVANPVTNKIDNFTEIQMILWKDAQARIDKCAPLRVITLGKMEGTYLTGSQVYAWVLERPGFEGAVEC